MGLVFACGAGAASETTNAAEILAASADLECFEYRVAGVCLWLQCDGFPPSCAVRTSIKYRHYTPDAVVAAYGRAGTSPWVETRFVAGSVPGVDGGRLVRGAIGKRATGLRRKLVDVIGSPGIAWVEALKLPTPVCEPAAAPMRPYYVSSADPLWRLEVLQAPATLANFLRKVPASGAAGPMWGGIYPRSGFVDQVHDYKAAAVVAQRAADLVTRRGLWERGHVYAPMLGSGGAGQWPPGMVVEGRRSTHKWQLLSPRRGACAVFDESAGEAKAGVVADRFGGNVSVAGGYVWNLWRPYECCERRGQVLLGH